MTQPNPRANGPPAGTLRDNVLVPPSRSTKDGGSLSAASLLTAKQASHIRQVPPPPGSFTSDLKSFSSRLDLNSYGGGMEDGAVDPATSEQKQQEYRQEIEKHTRLKAGTENLLEALSTQKAKKAKDQRLAAESQLNASNRKIAQLKIDLEAEIQRSKEQPMSPKGRLSQLFRPSLERARVDAERMQIPAESPEQQDPELESPTYILAEILQALEVEDMQPDYYVNQANDLVELFRRHPTLKYDLAWSIFGLRMQVMLLSDSREVVAAGYRVIRYAITDRKSLQTIRGLHTDVLVILSLVKESKARVEREQAIKFVRSFLDVRDGIHEIHPAIVRIIAAVADHSDDQLRSIAILTLAEMLLKDPMLVVIAGGISVLSDAMGSGVYHAPETLIGPLLHLMDLPARRGVLRSGFEFSSAFATFTEPHASHLEERLVASSRVIAGMFKSWSGLMTLSLHDFLPVRSVVSSLYIADFRVRTATLDLLADILRLEKRSWSTPFIGGRRLTTYARVATLNLENDPSQHKKRETDNDRQKRNLVQHFIAVALAVLLRHGLLQALLHAEHDAPTDALRRRTNLIIAEVLKKASELLPTSWSAQLQTMPGLFNNAVKFDTEERHTALSTVYQVDKVNLKLWRSDPSTTTTKTYEETDGARARSASKTQATAEIDEVQFRARVLETGVLNTVNYLKWDWTIIQELIDGPLTNPKLLHEAVEKSKFVHRLLKFLRPFQFRFSDASNTKANQRYVKMSCTLVKTLLQTSEGANFLFNNKAIRQLAECLAQLDSESGITSKNPLFSPDRLSDTLVGGYFAMLGIMCSDSKGLQILERWHIINMFYHIVELKSRDDLIKCLLTSLDYTLDSHPRIILSKAMIAGSKHMRIMATRILRKYAIEPVEPMTPGGGPSEWAIKLLVSQLYDPEIEVCEVAIRILEETCNDIRSLEYVVKCRPALDHLGEIGAPLLLRFLSTSVGYHYLDGLDYITREMDDWFLGRNDSYVTVVEASLARALSDLPEKPQSSLDDTLGPQDFGYVPPHFYRELTRTAEGCELLKAKGHFEEFTATIQDFAMEDEDPETILKVKGCLWAVGNVGSMELGAPFLEHTDVVKYIVQIAEDSQVMTLRGTAFFVLGLISRSLHGQEILAEYGWDGTVNVMGESLGYVLPVDFEKLFSLQPFANPGRKSAILHSRPGAITDVEPQNQHILDSITKLGNTVLTNKALTELNGFKHKKVAGFESPALFRKVMILLASHAYRIPQYRFVIDLFDKSVLRKIVLEEDEDSDGTDSSRDE
ncbi:Target of rapamycin complex 2 subunit ste20 [Fulvia fulva]|nr:Target of rapamycin complex 2 subunit ste20 [Fulvia fulva]KAK4620712.1 Target of rapamycin complex 2 subunit ste20 [Fulvia fulva]WPV17543.1 Target of rapamycin complex 2 subunit ste20 [Fulvia fulva]WPV32519.1 Target of rapamycin complex 2 subunit ste20 [Fulvia fulva]